MTGSSATGPLLFVVAGEASGDLIGGRVMAALRRRLPGVRFAGIGGPQMAQQGLASLFPMVELSLGGVIELLPHLPRLYRRIYQTVAAIKRSAPALVLFIDASGFSRAVAKRLAGLKAPIVQYKAPQAWAYLPRRGYVMARHFDRVLTILPFEQAFFARYGVPCTFIGHPAMESGADRGDGAAFRRHHGIADDQPLLCVLPGSRPNEIRWSLPILGEAVARLAREWPGLRVVVPTIEPVAARVKAAAGSWAADPILIEGDAERFAAFAAADLALAVSGTVTVELAMAGVPMVVCYRGSAVTALIVRQIITVRYASLVNLILDAPVIPEHIQGHCQAAEIADTASALLADPARRAAMTARLGEAIALMQAGDVPPSEHAAAVIIGLLEEPVARA